MESGTVVWYLASLTRDRRQAACQRSRYCRVSATSLHLSLSLSLSPLPSSPLLSTHTNKISTLLHTSQLSRRLISRPSASLQGRQYNILQICTCRCERPEIFAWVDSFPPSYFYSHYRLSLLISVLRCSPWPDRCPDAVVVPK